MRLHNKQQRSRCRKNRATTDTPAAPSAGRRNSSSIRKVASQNLLVVHHGLFWQGAQRIEGALYRKLKLAMDHDLAIYSAHLPLDMHPELGNNALLVGALGFAGESRP